MTKTTDPMQAGKDRAHLVHQHSADMLNALTDPKNVAKGSWRYLSTEQLFQLLKREVEELQLALWQFSKGECGPERVGQEAADVSAFAAMIADVARNTA